MKQIPCGLGKFALVDDADYNWLSHYMWTTDSHGYATIDLRLSTLCDAPIPKGGCISMHRLILGLKNGQGHKKQGDHKNHSILDNRRNNLRICTPSQNHGNQLLQQNTTSRYKGVYWNKQCKKWLAQIKIDGKKIYLGLFNNERTAAFAYNLAAKKHFKNFALLNKIG